MTQDRQESAQSKVSFGDFLRSRRSELGKTQRQMGLPSGHISQVESGEITRVSPTTLLELAEAYRLPLSELLVATDIDQELVASAQAMLIGQAVMQLPVRDRQLILEAISIVDRF